MLSILLIRHLRFLYNYLPLVQKNARCKTACVFGELQLQLHIPFVNPADVAQNFGKEQGKKGRQYKAYQ